MRKPFWAVAIVAASGLASVATAALLGEGPALGPFQSRTTQAEVASGNLSLHELRLRGLRMFATQFNQYDGYGDGPMNPSDTTSPGGRPTLGGNGTFLRINGLDAQSCNDCHGFISTASVPPKAGVGGSGGLNNAAMFMPHNIDVADHSFTGQAGFDGRLIVPPALFGVGGLQLLGKEMTADLQTLRQYALANPGEEVRLVTKDVDFGVIVANASGVVDTSGIEGIDADLVVKPFGRKGEFSSVRAFDQEAMRFHFGLEPSEIVGSGVDADGDGVTDEVLPGELSALEIFLTTQDTNRRAKADNDARTGFKRFQTIGCAHCHRPALRTESRYLDYSFPEVPADPSANVYYTADLAAAPPRFRLTRDGGLTVPLFGDLKRHDLGPGLSEQFQGADEHINREFITAELWGVADTAPYLHDGRALTLNAAIMAHGGEADAARAAYANLSETERSQVLAFLRTLRTPARPNADVLEGGD